MCAPSCPPALCRANDCNNVGARLRHRRTLSPRVRCRGTQAYYSPVVFFLFFYLFHYYYYDDYCYLYRPFGWYIPVRRYTCAARYIPTKICVIVTWAAAAAEILYRTRAAAVGRSSRVYLRRCTGVENDFRVAAIYANIILYANDFNLASFVLPDFRGRSVGIIAVGRPISVQWLLSHYIWFKEIY